MKAVILVAGEGNRLKPITDNTPKPMLEVGGIPLLERTINRVKEAGIVEILLITNYLEDQIIDYFGNGAKHGVRISYKTQEETLGTAHAFSQALEWVGFTEFMALYGDHYLGEGVLKGLRETHREGEVTASTMKVEDPSQYGVFVIKGDLITQVIEKPPKGSDLSDFANLGVYIFPPKVFSYIEKTPKSPRGEYEITDTIQMMIEDGIAVRKHNIAHKDWLDIGLPWSLLEANRRAMSDLEYKIEGTIEEGVSIHGPVWVKKGARVRTGVYIEGPVVIGENADIGPNCYIRASTCLGANTRVGNACEVKNSIIGNGTHTAHLNYIGDSVIGKDCNFGAGTITANLRFDKSNIEVTIKGERMDSGRKKLGVIVGDNVQTGINVNFHPGVVVGSGSWIAPGITVQRDVRGNVIQYFFSELRERDR